MPPLRIIADQYYKRGSNWVFSAAAAATPEQHSILNAEVAKWLFSDEAWPQLSQG